ncbi:MAG: hypothetical protein IPN34_14350 [Planctomycetes bacterium]|nr:hypothetical protein [Planctomycetota bacterium]
MTARFCGPLLSVGLSLSLLGSAAFAHGGQYRGSRDIIPPSSGSGSSGAAVTAPPPTKASTDSGVGGSATAGSSGSSMSAGLDISLPVDAWDYWWIANRMRFLDLRRLSRALESEVEDGPIAAKPRIEAALRARIGARLQALLAPGTAISVDELSGALIAASKLAWQPNATAQLFRAHLRSPVQEIRETATLALGWLGEPSALPLLLAILEDAPAAREATLNATTDVRTRSFAAYALALFLERTASEWSEAGSMLVRQRLLDMLDGRALAFAELEAAVISALGIMKHGEGVERGLVLERLQELLRAKDRHALVRAQVATAGGRIGRGVWANTLCEVLREEVFDWPVRDSAALVMGAFAPELDAAQRTAALQALELARRRAKGPGERAFTTLTIARFEDADSLKALEREVLHGPHLDRPWAAVGLGLAARAATERGEVPMSMRFALREGFRRTKASEIRAAFAIASGLARDLDFAKELREDFAASSVPRHRGHLAVALGLIGDPEAKKLLRAALPRASREPEEVGELAIGLTLLGDRDAVPSLLELLKAGKTTTTLAPLAEALGRIGGASAAEALLVLCEDQTKSALVRAFALVGLGLCVEEQELPWNAAFAADFNYIAPPITLYASKGLLDIL